MVLTFKLTAPLYTEVAFFYFENCDYCPHLIQHCVRLYTNASCLTNQAFRLSTARAAKIYFLQHIARIQSTQVGIRPHADKLIMSVLHIRCIVPIVACFILRGKGRDLQFLWWEGEREADRMAVWSLGYYVQWLAMAPPDGRTSVFRTRPYVITFMLHLWRMSADMWSQLLQYDIEIVCYTDMLRIDGKDASRIAGDMVFTYIDGTHSRMLS